MLFRSPPNYLPKAGHDRWKALLRVEIGKAESLIAKENLKQNRRDDRRDIGRMCICVCVYVYVYIYIYVSICMCIYIYIFIYLYIHTYRYMYIILGIAPFHIFSKVSSMFIMYRCVVSW